MYGDRNDDDGDGLSWGSNQVFSPIVFYSRLKRKHLYIYIHVL